MLLRSDCKPTDFGGIMVRSVEQSEVREFCLELLQACNDLEVGYERNGLHERADLVMIIGVLISETMHRMDENGI